MTIKATEPSGMELDNTVRQILLKMSTATISMVLLKQGLRNVWIRSSVPLDGQNTRVVGPAFTMRFVPAREDLTTPQSLSSPFSTRAAVEEMPAGSIAVVDAMRTTEAGILGDILCMRMKKREVAGLVTDGAIRDLEGILATELPIWCGGVAAPPSVSGLTFVGWQQPIACGGVAIFPGDILIADRDGVVVVPAALLDIVLKAGPETELLDSWVLSEVAKGRKLPGLYPPNEETTKEFEVWRRAVGTSRGRT